MIDLIIIYKLSFDIVGASIFVVKVGYEIYGRN